MKARMVKWLARLGVAAIVLVAIAPAEASAAEGGDHWSAVNWIIPHGAIEKLKDVWGNGLMSGEPASRTMHVIMGLIAFILGLFLTTKAMQRVRSKGDEGFLPEKKFGLFTFFELIAQALMGIMTDTMGKKHARYFFPLMMALTVFILFSNLLGLVPGLLPATDNLNTTLALGLIVFMVTHIYGVREHGFINYFAHFMGPIRAWYALPLMLLMFFIEIVSHVVRPLSLAIRLFGNMFGDHAVLGVFLSFAIPLLPLPIMLLGLLVAVVQTLVFVLLSIVYIALAVEHAEEH